MNRRILLEWPDLQLSAIAELADDKNPELCDDLWNALPICSIMNNAVITDGSMYCWLPLLSFAPIHYKERIDEAPIGRLRYSQGTGNKLIVQYSQCYEDVKGTVLGEIIPEHIDIVKKVGEKARESIFMTKKELHIRVSRLGEDKAAEPAKPEVVRPKDCRAEVTELVDRILEKALEATKSEPRENKLARMGKVSGVGSCGQYFSTWEFVYSLSRDSPCIRFIRFLICAGQPTLMCVIWKKSTQSWSQATQESSAPMDCASCANSRRRSVRCSQRRL